MPRIRRWKQEPDIIVGGQPVQLPEAMYGVLSPTARGIVIRSYLRPGAKGSPFEENQAAVPPRITPRYTGRTPSEVRENREKVNNMLGGLFRSAADYKIPQEPTGRFGRNAREARKNHGRQVSEIVNHPLQEGNLTGMVRRVQAGRRQRGESQPPQALPSRRQTFVPPWRAEDS